MAIGQQTFSDFGTAVSDFGAGVSDLFAAKGDEAKAKFDLAEQQQYTLAGQFAGQEEQYTAMSTQIKQAQQEREAHQALGTTSAQIAGAGFGASGSAMDILRSGAQQGALSNAVLGEQGLITEQGYQEQQQSYTLMAGAAGEAAQAEEDVASGAKKASMFSFAGGSLSAIAGIASIFLK
jgi:hypothetical protein